MKFHKVREQVRKNKSQKMPIISLTNNTKASDKRLKNQASLSYWLSPKIAELVPPSYEIEKAYQVLLKKDAGKAYDIAKCLCDFLAGRGTTINFQK